MDQVQLELLLSGMDEMQKTRAVFRLNVSRKWDRNCVIEEDWWAQPFGYAEHQDVVEYYVHGGLFYYGKPE